MKHLDSEKKIAKIFSAVTPLCGQMSILKTRVCKTNADICPFGGNLMCLQSKSLQIQNVPHNCKEHLIRLGLESAKTVWQVAEVLAEDIFLIDNPSPELLHFLETEKAKQSQI